jgi:hypothetical protein
VFRVGEVEECGKEKTGKRAKKTVDNRRKKASTGRV